MTLALPQLASAAAQKREDLDGLRWYTYPRDGREFVSVTTVLGSTNAKHYLKAHAAKVATQFTLDNIGVITELIAEGHPQAELIDLIKDEAERIRDRKARAGSFIHDVVQAMVLWQASPKDRGGDFPFPEIPDDLATVDMEGVPLRVLIDSMIDSWTAFVAAHNLGPKDFLACEMSVFNAELEIAGTLDLIVILRDRAMGPKGLYRKAGAVLVLCIDVKTGKYMDATWKPQVASYRRMREALVNEGELIEMPPTDAAAVLWLRPEHGFRLMVVSDEDDLAGWNTMVHALHTYRGYLDAKAKPGRVVYPPLPDGSPAPTRTLDLFAEGYSRAPVALHKAGIGTIADLARECVESLLEYQGIGPGTVPFVRQIMADNGYELAELGDDYPTRNTILWYEQPLAGEDEGLAKKLDKVGITTVGELATLTEAEVKDLAGIGPKAFEAAWHVLASHDLEFDTVRGRMARAEAERTHPSNDERFHEEEVA